MRISDWSSDVCSSDLRIPTQVVHAAPFLASWIKRNVARPLIIGPDLESEQWVSQVAADADAPFLVCEKIRSGDRHVTISIPNAPAFLDRQPVLVDDIASSGRTLTERSEEHTYELQSLMRISYAVFCLKTKKQN